MATDLGRRRARCAPRDRQGPRGLPRGSHLPERTNCVSRVDRLRASREEGLLVSNGPNVRYLTGFESSNAALLVEPGRVRLFSDFRYAEAGRAVPGVEFVETKRNLYADL